MKLKKVDNYSDACEYAVLHEPDSDPIVFVKLHSIDGPIWRERAGLTEMSQSVIDQHEHFHHCIRLPHTDHLKFHLWILEDDVERQVLISEALELLGISFVANYFEDYYSLSEVIRGLAKISRATGETVPLNKIEDSFDIAILDLFVPYGHFHAQEPAGWGLEAAHLIKTELPHNNIFTKVITEKGHHDIEFLHHIRGSLGVEWYDLARKNTLEGWLYTLTKLFLEWEEKNSHLKLPLLIV